MPAGQRLRSESHFALVSNGENAHLIAANDESVERHVAGVAVGNHELADVTSHAPAEQRMCGECVDCRLDRRDCFQGGLWVVFSEELKGTLEVRQ
jgi:hypothetical protein